MPTTTLARSRAPYIVYSGDNFVFLATGLAQLHAFLREHETACANQKERAQEQRGIAVGHGVPWYDLRHGPVITVRDNRNMLRPDLASSWSIRWNFAPGGRRGGGVPNHFVEAPWDGDIRPRGEPIAGTGGRCRYSRMYYRWPRTQRDRRLSYPVADDGEPVVRGARRAGAIPNAWDDLPRRGHQDRSWKRFRGNQWIDR